MKQDSTPKHDFPMLSYMTSITSLPKLTKNKQTRKYKILTKFYIFLQQTLSTEHITPIHTLNHNFRVGFHSIDIHPTPLRSHMHMQRTFPSSQCLDHNHPYLVKIMCRFLAYNEGFYRWNIYIYIYIYIYIFNQTNYHLQENKELILVIK